MSRLRSFIALVTTLMLVLGLAGSPAASATATTAGIVRHGYVADRGDRPIRPVVIDFEEPCEEEIAEAVSRLDQIGDLVDGMVSNGEILDLLQLLGEP